MLCQDLTSTCDHFEEPSSLPTDCCYVPAHYSECQRDEICHFDFVEIFYQHTTLNVNPKGRQLNVPNLILAAF